MYIRTKDRICLVAFRSSVRRSGNGQCDPTNDGTHKRRDAEIAQCNPAPMRYSRRRVHAKISGQQSRAVTTQSHVRSGTKMTCRIPEGSNISAFTCHAGYVHAQLEAVHTPRRRRATARCVRSLLKSFLVGYALGRRPPNSVCGSDMDRANLFFCTSRPKRSPQAWGMEQPPGVW